MVYYVIKPKTLLRSCNLKILCCIIWYFQTSINYVNSNPGIPICAHTSYMYLLEYNNIIQLFNDYIFMKRLFFFSYTSLNLLKRIGLVLFFKMYLQ